MWVALSLSLPLSLSLCLLSHQATRSMRWVKGAAPLHVMRAIYCLLAASTTSRERERQRESGRVGKCDASVAGVCVEK